MKKYLSLLGDLSIIVFTGVCVGIIEALFSNYNPEMINILTKDLLYSLFIGGTARFTFVILAQKKNKVSLWFVFFILTLILIVGFTVIYNIENTKNIFKTASVFGAVWFIVLYLGYTQYMFEIKLNSLLDRKKQQLFSTQSISKN